MPSSRCVLRRHSQQPAHGLLSAGAIGARCARAWRRNPRPPMSISAPGIARSSPCRTERCAVRLGFRQVKGLQGGRDHKSSSSIAAMAMRASSVWPPRRRFCFTLYRLAEADAFSFIGLDRRAALWMTRRLGRLDIEPIKQDGSPSTATCRSLQHIWVMSFSRSQSSPSRRCSSAKQVIEDYQMTGLSLKAHPCTFFRDDLRSPARSPARIIAMKAEARQACHRCRPCSGAPAAGNVQGRRLHDLRR